MEKNGWERIMDDSEALFYTNFLWLFCSLVTVIFGIKYYRNEKINHYLLIYSVVSLFMMNIALDIINFTYFSKRTPSKIFYESINTLFALIEITCFTFFFRNLLSGKVTKQLIRGFESFFIAICLFFLFSLIKVDLSILGIKQISYLINIIEFFFLLLLCLLYFYRLLSKENNTYISFNNSPSIWITCGLFLYCSVSLPFLLIAPTLFIKLKDFYFIMGSIHYIGISILLLCIAKAFSCKAPLTT